MMKQVRCKNCLHVDVCDGLWFNLDKVCIRQCIYFKDKSEHTSIEQAYQDGYADGQRDVFEKLKSRVRSMVELPNEDAVFKALGVE